MIGFIAWFASSIRELDLQSCSSIRCLAAKFVILQLDWLSWSSIRSLAARFAAAMQSWSSIRSPEAWFEVRFAGSIRSLTARFAVLKLDAKFDSWARVEQLCLVLFPDQTPGRFILGDGLGHGNETNHVCCNSIAGVRWDL